MFMMPETDSPFDLLASDYDDAFTYSEIGKLQRGKVWEYLDSLSLSSASVLELNCGTGEDALHLAKKGHNVVATDVSFNMIVKAEEKMKRAGAKNITFLVSDMREVKKQFSGQRFDFIFSNFGGLNCLSENELNALSQDLLSLLKPGGRLVLVMMSRKCVWENFYFLLKGNFSSIFRRRKRGGIEFKAGNTILQTYYYSPREIMSLFGHGWQMKKQLPVGFFVPPSYLQTFFQRHPKLLRFLAAMDRHFSAISFLADYADHFILHLEPEK